MNPYPNTDFFVESENGTMHFRCHFYGATGYNVEYISTLKEIPELPPVLCPGGCGDEIDSCAEASPDVRNCYFVKCPTTGRIYPECKKTTRTVCRQCSSEECLKNAFKVAIKETKN